jgi:hypothetical protein
MEWINQAQDRGQWRAVVITVINLRVLWNVDLFLSGWATGCFSWNAQLRGVRMACIFLHVHIYTCWLLWDCLKKRTISSYYVHSSLKKFNFEAKLQYRKWVDIIILARMNTHKDTERPCECERSVSLDIRLYVERRHLIPHADRLDVSKRYRVT